MRDQRFFLKPDHLNEWAEVTKEQFVKAESAAGFHSKFGPGEIATGGFSGHGMNGRVVSAVNYDYYHQHEPEFYALLVKP